MQASDVLKFKTRIPDLHLPAGDKKRILVIDDDKSVLEMIEEALSYSNFEVNASLNCDNVFDIIAEFKPNLLLIDFLLTGINGGELCHQVKTNSATAHIPVIMMSGFPKVFLSLGNYNCDLFITKPFDLDELLEKVNLCIGKTT